MERVSLSDAGDWQLVNDSQDIRGYNVVDAAGQPVGTVEALLLDTERELVTTLVLDNGTEIAAADVTIGQDVVYLDAEVASAAEESVTVFDDSGHVVRRESVDDADFDAYADDFRAHHETTYGTAGRAYDDDAEAYRYGFDRAHDDTYRNRAYGDAEADLRTGYASDAAGRDFDADREAVRYGYGRAQRRA